MKSVLSRYLLLRKVISLLFLRNLIEKVRLVIYSFYYKIKIINWWDGDYKSNWFLRFILDNDIKPKKIITLHSVFGNKPYSDPSIFFSGENLRLSFKEKISEINKSSIALTFEPDSIKNIYFPLWILYFFEPRFTFETIKEKFDFWNSMRFQSRPDFAALVASHDADGYREMIVNQLSHIGFVSCGGKFIGNDERLKIEFNDNKKDYLSRFRFNICPENSDEIGYITEKIFEAIDAGCIPIYRGSKSSLGIIFNPNRVIFSDDEDFFKTVSRLESCEREFMSFYEQPAFTEFAPLYVYDKLLKLKNSLDIICKK